MGHFQTELMKPVLSKSSIKLVSINSLSLIAESNPRAKNRKAEEFMDTSFMEELERTGFISSVWK